MNAKETIKRMIRQDRAVIYILVLALIAVAVGALIVEAKSSPAIYIPEPAGHVVTETAAFDPPVMTFTADEIESRIAKLEDEKKAEEPRRLEIIEVPKPDISDDDRYCLACAICQEVGGLDEYMQTLVGNVVLNRVASPYFPNTIRGVLEQRYQYGMMWKYGVKFPGWATEADKAQCYAVADRLLGGLRVCPENVVYQAEFPQGSETYYYSDGVYFCCE